MSIDEIKAYYDATVNREVRSDLSFAVDIVGEPKVAIDCGCGAGADIAYLLTAGFKVYGFDSENESISRCRKRFENNNDVTLSQANFSSYHYPKSSLVVADASLFYCPKVDFDLVWRKIYTCLDSNGIFCGSFLGPEDTMAQPIVDKNTYWPERSVFDEKEVRDLFDNYEICRFTEHKTSGKTPDGTPHNWHIYSVVAIKSNKSRLKEP